MSCNGAAPGEDGQGFKAAADPNLPTNSRFFATNSNTLIFEDTATLFPTMPESGEPASGHPIR
jgi:hypothetical protein